MLGYGCLALIIIAVIVAGFQALWQESPGIIILIIVAIIGGITYWGYKKIQEQEEEERRRKEAQEQKEREEAMALKRLEEAKSAYETALKKLQEDPESNTLRQAALNLGREFVRVAQKVTQEDADPVFTEIMLQNDLMMSLGSRK